MKIKFLLKEITNPEYFAKWKRFFNYVLKDWNYTTEYNIQDILFKRGFTRLGKGSFRSAFAFPENAPYVLKIGNEKISNRMNQREVDASIQTKYASILPKMYISAKDYKWIVTEKVRPARWEDISKHIVGARDIWDFVGFLRGVKSLALTDTVKNAVSNAMERAEVKQISATMNKIIDFSIEYNIAVWDLHEKNLGVNEEGNLVILDSSFQTDITDEEHNRW